MFCLYMHLNFVSFCVLHLRVLPLLFFCVFLRVLIWMLIIQVVNHSVGRTVV